MVEVDRLPDVQGERAGRRGVARPRAQPAVGAVADAVEAGARVERRDGRGGVGLARSELGLSGLDELTRAERAAARGVPLGEVPHAAAEHHAERPHLSRLGSRTGRERALDDGVVVTGATLAALAQAQARCEAQALGLALPQPAAGEVEGLDGALGDGQPRGQLVERVDVVAGVGEDVVDEEHALGGDRQRLRDLDAKRLVDEAQRAGSIGDRRRGDGEERREAGLASVTAQRRPAGEATGALAKGAGVDRLIEVAVRDAAVDQRADGRTVHAAQRGTPVEHDGVAIAEVEHQLDACRAQHGGLDGVGVGRRGHVVTLL